MERAGQTVWILCGHPSRGGVVVNNAPAEVESQGMDKTDKIGQGERGSPGEEGEGELQYEHAEPGVCVSVVSSSDSGPFLGAYRHLVMFSLLMFAEKWD